MEFKEVFGTVTEFHTVFMQGLDRVLARDDLGTASFNLVFGNAILHHKERDFLERLEAAKLRLAEKINLAATDDDTVIFLKLKEMNLDWQNWTMIEDLKINSWNVQLNKFRLLKPGGFSEKTITNLHQSFDPNDFNFNKISDPTIWSGEADGHKISLFYNKFPYKDLQALLVLDPLANKEQFITKDDHLFVWRMISSLSNLYNVSLGFNSLGASASVNHLHFHLMIGIEKLAVAEAKWKHNGGDTIYPANIYVFEDPEEAWKLIDKLNSKNIAFNLLYLPGKIYVFPRKFLGTYPNPEWSVGFGWYQFSGNFIVYDEDMAKSLTDEKIREALATASVRLEEDKKMSKFMPVAKVSQIKEGEPFCAEIDGVSIAIYKVGDKFYATTGVCTHAGGPLCQGELNSGVVTCPWHGSKFEVVTGKVVHGPAQNPIKTYEVQVNGDAVEVNVV